ncbi:MAG: hypothetical protein HQM12_09395 [SAR324 cluster bacterium]|nr:hypothetical protein [SAR324 cluster bacterium]
MLRVNQPVVFQLMSSIHRPQDQAGAILLLNAEEKEREFIELPPLQTLITPDRQLVKKKTLELEIHLKAILNEIGTLSLFCVDAQRNQEWKLAFQLRAANTAAQTDDESLITLAEEDLLPARACLQEWFGRNAEGSVSGGIYRQMEQALEMPREEWSIPLLRGLWPFLYEGMGRRTRSVNHELNWLKLAGFCLRPGYGCRGDELKMRQVMELFPGGPHFRKERAIEIEWWVMCRRIAGGISTANQQLLLDLGWKKIRESAMKPRKGTLGKTGKKGGKNTAVASPTALNELWRLLASLEHLPPQEKLKLGHELISQVKLGQSTGIEGWCLARIGGRVPVYGSPVNAVSVSTVESWIDWLLSLSPEITFYQDLPLILSKMGQLTEDRSRDISDRTRNKIIDFLKKKEGTEALQQILQVPTDENLSSATSNDWLFGDKLPSGLKLIKPLD